MGFLSDVVSAPATSPRSLVRGISHATLGSGTFFSVVLRLPEPALARPGPIPVAAGWVFEPKLDGFRCLTCTHGRFRARSRRGWDMTALLPEIAASLPANLQLDGELVAWDGNGHPDFHRLSSRVLHGRSEIALTYMVFDVI